MSITGIQADQAILVGGPLMLILAHFLFAPFNTAYKLLFARKKPDLADILAAQRQSQSEYLWLRVATSVTAMLMFYLSYAQDSVFLIAGIVITLILCATSSILHYRCYLALQSQTDSQ